MKSSFEKLLPEGSLLELDRRFEQSTWIKSLFGMGKGLLEVDGLTKPLKLGPLVKFGECPLERYSRVNIVLKSLRLVLSPSKWSEFLKSGDKFPLLPIHTSAIPQWMKKNEVSIDSTRLIERSGPQKLPLRVEVGLDCFALCQHAKVIQVKLDRLIRSKWAIEVKIHEKEYLEFNELQLPTKNMVEKNP